MGWPTPMIPGGRLMSAAFNVFNHLRMAGNIRLFGTATLKGNGMAFRREILERYGWPAHSVVEDVEILSDAAEGSGEHPLQSGRSHSQRDGGQALPGIEPEAALGRRAFALARELIPRLAGKCLRGELRYFHALMDLVVPPLSLLLMAVMAALVVSWLLVPTSLAVP